MKVLHVLETSAPHTVGYTVRAGAILRHQKAQGFEVVVVTSPLFPAYDGMAPVDEIDGIRYYRTNHIPPPSTARTRLGSYVRRVAMMSRYRRAVLEVARREKVDVIHAHSSYANAYAALPARRTLGVPVVYEVRTLWGESAVVEDGWTAGSIRHRAIWRLELGAMRRVDLVIPIARGIFDELVSRGIPSNKMRIVPNGVDTSRFAPVDRDPELARSAGLDGCFVVGFVGSMRKLEGLGTLLDACHLCQQEGARIGLALVGDGPDRTGLEQQATRLALKNVVFTGQVRHAEVSSWYSVMDVVAYPRVRAVINERVTPLKPLEVMAMGKVCIASDVGGLTELIEDGVTGVIFSSGNARSLADAIMRLREDDVLRATLGSAAQDYVKREREWSQIVAAYLEIYHSLIGRRSRA